MIEDSSEARLLLRRERRMNARADAPWRQPVPPLIRHEVIINSQPVRQRKSMTFGRGVGQFNTPRSIHIHYPEDTPQSTRNLHDTDAATSTSRRRRKGAPAQPFPRASDRRAMPLDTLQCCVACARPGSGRPPATPPKKFPFLRKTPRKVQINHPLPYKKRIKEMQSTVMQDVRRSTLLHSQRVAEARAAAGEEVCGAFDSMVDGVITQAEIERR